MKRDISWWMRVKPSGKRLLLGFPSMVFLTWMLYYVSLVLREAESLVNTDTFYDICYNVVTHEHSDAMLGMDDLREAQKSKTTLPVYMSERCYQRVHDTFGYLMTSEPEYLDGVQKTIPAMKKATASKSFTAALKCTVVASPDLSEAKKPRKFSIQGMAVEAFPVYHGKNNLTLGFVFGSGTSKFVYISDMHELPKDSETYLKSLNIELLMVDAIHPHKPWGDSHQSVEQAIKFGLKMGATELLLTGLGHKVLHKETSDDLPRMVEDAKKELKSKNSMKVRLCYDGMSVSLEKMGIEL